MKVGSRAKPSIAPVEPGTYIGVCIGVIDLGEQETTYNGKTRYVNQVQLIFELPDELIEVDGDWQPRWLSRRFTMSASSRAKLRQFIETWQGKQFSDADFKDFELFELLNRPAMLSVVLSEDGNYANIAAAAALPKSLPVPKAKGVLMRFDMDEWDDQVFAGLPEYLQELIQKSTQYKSSHLPQEEVSLEAAEAAASQAAQAEDPEGGVPF